MSQYPPVQPGQMVSRDAPGATASLVMGIISIVFSVPIVGLILAWVGMTKGKAAKMMCDANPGYYTNAGVAQAGYVICIIGMVLNSLSSLCVCGYFGFLALMLVAAGSSVP